VIAALFSRMALINIASRDAIFSALRSSAKVSILLLMSPQHTRSSQPMVQCVLGTVLQLTFPCTQRPRDSGATS
jgi:hypothetical protein